MSIRPRRLPAPATAAGDILREAAAIVDGARNATHGDKEASFAAIAAMWQTYLRSRQRPDGPVRAVDVAQMMVLQKMMRAEFGKPVRDHYRDQAGFSAVAGQLSEA